jgi:hypothetical protein
MRRQSAEVRNPTGSFIRISGDGEVVGCLKTKGKTDQMADR